MRVVPLLVAFLASNGTVLAQVGEGEHSAAAAARKRAEAIKSVVVVFDMKEVMEPTRGAAQTPSQELPPVSDAV